ncbi:hypothetical protein A3A69_01360 [candidate division WWE3 bacterium RIFCSPLOWO2_01_FULL_37_15]|uniref:Uncharacterized protein n=1 Tax=candidate division WWE3 bacterium RIFCSPLOWO2_01_FULL_37_15 TaxID=1802622 RepID=A0A1F4UUU0_UNCKA|nr:MAG: hypothetical protein A3A69_01360 [candidate division WWE3 bacterium RIFCSPLOWO2_01_FULL_37_15]
MLKTIFTKKFFHILIALIFPAILFQLVLFFNKWLYQKHLIEVEPLKLLGVSENSLGYLLLFLVPIAGFLIMLVITGKLSFISALPLIVYYPLELLMLFGVVTMMVNSSVFTSPLKEAHKMYYPDLYPKEDSQKEEIKPGTLEFVKFDNGIAGHCKTYIPDIKGKVCFIEFAEDKNTVFYKTFGEIDDPVFIASGNIPSFTAVYTKQIGQDFVYSSKTKKLLGELTILHNDEMTDINESGLYLIDLNKKTSFLLISLRQANASSFSLFRSAGNGGDDSYMLISSYSCKTCYETAHINLVDFNSGEIIQFEGDLYKWLSTTEFVYFENPEVVNDGSFGPDFIQVQEMRNFKKYNVLTKQTEPILQIKYSRTDALRILYNYFNKKYYSGAIKNIQTLLDDGYWQFDVLEQDPEDSSGYEFIGEYRVYYDTGKVEKVNTIFE